MKKGNYLSTILRSKQTVLSSKDIMLLWGETDSAAVRVRINYYVKKGDIYRVRRGFYAKDKNYNKLELATKIFTPSYVSLETMLGQAGVTFQYYNQIFVVSCVTREIFADRQMYSYKRIKDAILINPAGIESKDNYSIAIPERAFLDVVYLNKDYHFDNLGPLNWDKIFEILPIYGGNKRMEKMVKKYHEALKAETR